MLCPVCVDRPGLQVPPPPPPPPPHELLLFPPQAVLPAGMDPQLLARLPDAAKLGILRHLSGGQPAAPPAGKGQQQDQPQQTPALPPELPKAVVGRSLEGGLAIVDSFLDQAEVKVRHAWAWRC